MFDAWLEIGPCSESVRGRTLEEEIIRSIPALAKAFSAAEQARSSKRSAHWDYSLRLCEEELEAVRDAIGFSKKVVGERAIILFENVSHRGYCYALRLFIEKSQ
jgi:hypothetical protein